MDKSFGRNIKNMLYIIGKSMLIFLAFASIYVILGVVSGMDLRYWQSSSNILGVVKYISILVITVINVSFATAYQNIILSFGTTKKSYFAAKFVLLFSVLLITFVISGVLICITPKMGIADMLYTIGQMIGFSAIMLVSANLILKLGTGGYIIFCGICGVIGGVIGFFMGFASENTILAGLIFPIVFCVVAVVALAGAMILDKKLLWNYEIR